MGQKEQPSAERELLKGGPKFEACESSLRHVMTYKQNFEDMCGYFGHGKEQVSEALFKFQKQS